MRYFLLFLLFFPACLQAQRLFQLPADAESHLVSFENPNGEKGVGGQLNKGAKGHPFDIIKAGETKKIFDIKGTGIINRIWLTISNRDPVVLRSIRIDMYWDGASKPAVSAPIGDFFGIGLGRRVPFQSALFSDPEGRSFNCYIEMPFKKGAVISITNESGVQETLFYDISFLKMKQLPGSSLYFHAYWNSNADSKLGEDFDILPKITGKGRFLGANFGITTDTSYQQTWWGEGEVKMYLDGDSKNPTLVGTGTEDYIGSAWGLGAFSNLYQGCPIADDSNRQWTFYRYHISDPVYFKTDCHVAIQQIGGDAMVKVRELFMSGVKLIPVSVTQSQYKWHFNVFEQATVPKITDANFPDGWTNFYRLDNYSATSYFYLDKPTNDLPALRPLKDRLAGIK